jgi:sugar lactone lactonase YvrE
MRALRIVTTALALTIALAVIYLLTWPVPIAPVAWAAPSAPALQGSWAPDGYLDGVERIEVPFGVGPEDVAVDGEGRIYGGLQDGRIVRMANDGSEAEVFADTGGRPLGLAFDAAGHLVVADAFQGLLSVSPSGEITTLSTEADGLPFTFTDDVDIAPNGVVYFTDASSRHDQHHYLQDIFESRGTGRLLAYDPATARTEVLLKDLHFANGVAVSPAGDFVLVNETIRYRVLRHWIAGPRQGETEVVIDNLPGFPDGVSRGAGGVYWIALIAPRNALLDWTAPRPFLRKAIWRLPEAVRPKAVRHPFVVGVDADGRVVHNLQGSADAPFAHITSVEQVGEVLYLGSLEETAVARIGAPR